MLLEIYCEQFHQKKVTFNTGFNVVLGTETADNSIGKSTFLLIVDFVFGGSTYTKATDIIDNIGKHDIYFSFKFDNKIYKFCRNNIDSNVVWECDKNYQKIKSMETSNYCKWLDNMYDMCLPDLSFRDAVGRYIRVYGKKNCGEDKPLHYYPSEKAENACYALLKLFNAYEPLKTLQEQANKSTEKYQIYTRAQTLNLVAKITKPVYEENKNKIIKINEDLESLSAGFEQGLLDVDVVASEEAIHWKDILSKAQRAKSKLKNKFNIIDENGNYKFSSVSKSFDDLKKYFPDTNIAKIEEIEAFHNKIATIFKSELKVEKNKLQEELNEYDSIINTCKIKLQELIKNPSLSRMVLSRHTDLLKERDMLVKQNEAYEQLTSLQTQKKTDIERLKTMKTTQFAVIETQINQEMTKLNNDIYGGTCNAPFLNFTDKNYKFFTPNDTGTGIACKGLVVFDISVMNLTSLAILVHDSVILKQISDEAIEEILKLYIATNKQVIIALDKQNSYTAKTTELLNNNAVLKLGSNGNELFGKSWG
ncbi:MAG: DUF2326 domain-containing protein [Candidatus Gastranaerophilales bacterium]|nr:DUF2326 domain-containing protein [Candidatus Gastranaerophilales bacterium]